MQLMTFMVPVNRDSSDNRDNIERSDSRDASDIRYNITKRTVGIPLM